ncbi:phage tail protein [Comamonas aquatica]|nr:phage tail protein [Comamonas aquatica]
MAQLVVSAVGAAVGFAIGGPAGAQIGWVAGSMVGAYAFAENQTHEGPRLKDLKITGTDYGDVVPWVQGSPRIAGQIIWASNRRETRHEEEVGGKGGGGGATQVTYTYDCDLLILLAENEIAGVSRVWSNNELIFSNGRAKNGAWRSMRVYNGTEDQLPDPTYEAAVGVGNAPAYRGHGYVVIEGLQLGGGGNLPNLTFEMGIAPAYDKSYLLSAVATRVDTDQNLYLDAGATNLPTWADNFSEYYDVGLFKFSRYTNLTAPGRTGVIASAGAIPIDNRYDYFLQASNGYWPGDRCGFRLSFLDAFGNIVVMMYSPGYLTGAPYVHELYYGNDPDNLTKTGKFINGAVVFTLGKIIFEPGLFRFQRSNSGSGENESFTFPCNAMGIRSVRISDVDVVSTYAGGSVNPAAYVTLRKFPKENQPTIAPNSVDTVVSNLFSRAGYGVSDFDTSLLAPLKKPVRALALSQVASTRSALEVLQKCWHFECSATERIAVRLRATTPVVRIPFVDIGFSSNTGGLDDPLVIKMGNDLEMPAQIALTYPNMAGDYNADSQFSDRLISGQQSTQTMQVPVGMLPAEAKGVADALLMDAVAGLQSTTLSVPLKYAFVEPGDVVEAVARDGRIYRLRVQTRKDQGIWLELECRLDDVGALDSAAITDEGYITVQDPASMPDTILHALDAPLLRDADDQPGFYLAAAPDSINVATDQWKGANVASSWDDVDYASLLSILEAATVGESLTVLPAWNGGPVFDEASVLRVEMLGQLSSTSRAAMLLDETVNALLVGDEVVRFRNAELVEADEDRGRYTYQLTGFIRGFRGTEWAMGGHAAGERCVLLNRSVRRVNTQLNELQVQRWLKATTVGKYITDMQPQAFTSTGRALKPFAPVGLRALTEEGVGVHLSWQRRTRLSYRYGGVSPSVPLGEATERYRVQVFAGDLLLRTEIVTQPQWAYTIEMSADDGLSSADAVRFEVCQLSDSVGPGYVTSKEGKTA